MKLGNFYLLAVFGVLVALGYAPAALANDIPVKGAFFHVDASDAKSMTFAPSTDGTNWVSKWTDTDGGSVFATSDKIPDYNPYLDQMGQRTIVNFGAVATSQGQRTKGVGCGMAWSQKDTSIREIFVAYAYGITGGVHHVLTDNTSNNGTYHFHNAGTTLFNAQYASDNVKNGFIELDLKNVPYNTTIPTNKLMLLHVRTTGNVTASAFGNDRNQYSFGRIRYGEVVVFNKTLSEAEAAQISNYLYDKWISEKPFAMVACSVRNGNFTISGEVLSTAGATGADQVDVYLAQSATEGDFTYEKIASGVKKDGKFLRQFSGLMPGNKRYWSVIVSNNLDGATYSGVAEDRNAPQYLFTRHAELTVPGYQGTSDLVRFPVLVRLKAGSPEGFSYADCAADGSDLRFADSEGKLLPHEIDTWDPAGESCIWVLLPKLTKGATKFNMYWRAVAGATLPPNDPTDVWVDYVGVWHFGEETGNALDSTANHFDGTNTSEATSKAAGKVGYSRQKDTSLFQTGINQLTSKAHPQPLKDPLYFSCSGWMKASSNATVYRQLFSKGDWNAKKGWYVQTQNDTTRMTLVGHNQDTASYNIADIYNAWGYFDCVYNNTTYTVYNNGANTTSAGGTGTKKGAEDSADCSLSFASGLAGQVDEFRIRNGVTTTDRVKADYDTQVSANFIAFGAAETQSFTEPVVGEVAVVVDEQAGTLTIVDTVLATGNGEETVDAYLSFSTNGVALEPVKFAGLRSGALVSHTLSGLTSADKVGFALMVSNSTYGATALNLRETPFNADDINAIVGLLEKADYAEYDPPTMKPGRQMRQDAVTGQYSGFDRLEVEANATGAEGETAWVFYAKTRAELEGEAWKIAKSFHLTAPAVAGVFTLDTDQLEGSTDYFLLPIYETEEGFARGEIVAYKSMQKAIGGLGKGGRIFMAKDGSGDIVHVFDTPGESVFTAPLETSGGLTYLLLGGGGAGGGSNNNAPTGSGGGGGGQFLEGEIATVGVGEVFTINIGLGGTCGGVSSRGGNGQASQLLDKDNKVIAEAIGGGGGGASWDSVTTAGVDGANGGGGARGGAGGKPTVAGGFAGGNGNGSWGGCGGGGAGGVGDPQNGGNANGGNGGLGKASTITGESVLYCGGGAGGGGSGSGGAAGLARGGGGLQKEKGFDGYGGGGGGGRYSVGGAGGCGAFIVRYPLPKGEVFVETKIEQAEIGATDIVLSNLAIISGEAETQVYLAYGLAGGEQGEERLVTESWTGVSPLTIPLTGLLAYSKYEYTLRFRLPSGIEQSWTYSFQTLGPEGTGGDEVLELSTGEKVHIFNTNGVFTAPVGAPVEVEYLIVGGGGASGGTDNYGYSGGGGGGQAVTGRVVVASGARLNIEVGAGGLPVNQARGKDGKDSWIEILGNDVLFETNQQFTAYGGGGGGRSNDGGGGWYRGTGGGGGCNSTRPGGTWNKSGVDLPAKRGGNGGNGSGGNDSGGGGGGAGADGGNASGATAGKGGDGIESFITGKSVWYGGGGGGGRGGAGGKGGGGVGNSGVGQDGLGGGGGGINWTYGTGLRGGSGIVILRYKPLSGDVFAGFAVTNRDFDHVDFACDLSTLAGGLPAVKLEYRHMEGVVTSAWQTVKANWQPPARDSFRDENLKAATEYEYEFRVSAGAVTNSYRGTFMTMGIHGTGGELHELDGGWIYHVFNEDETFVAPPMAVEVEYLMVGGGGASGGTDNYSSSGGGGGGQVVTGRVEVAAQGEIVVKIGEGGEPVYAGRGGDGKDSSIEVIGDVQQLETNQLYIAYGGGGGGRSNDGGGGWYRGTGGGGGCNGTRPGGTWNKSGVDLPAKRGGNGGNGSGGNDSGGGGGGAGADGGNASGATAGKGGDGIESFITGESVWYGGGGGGGGSPGGLGGKGGGGIGHSRTGSRDGEELGPQPGADGFGGGGGGIKWTYGTGVRGGRGVVILRYRALAGEIFADFAVTNRETDSVTFKGELAALAGGAVAATVDLRYTEKESGVTNFVPNCIANWHPGEARAVTISALKAATEYEYEFSVSAGAATNEYRGTFTTMGIHGTGGEIHELEGGWIYHVFNEDETFVAPPMPVELEYLLVGGGGGGGGCSGNGAYRGGGGGGGQVVTGRVELAAAQECQITVGQGGRYVGDNSRGGDGTDSMVEIFGDVQKQETNQLYIAYGGGGGGNGNGGGGWYRGTGGGGGNRGSGGTPATSGVSTRGGSGGNGYNSNNSAGGGGGAGANGANSPSDGTGGKGGDGIESFITGESVWYGGGGGGGGGSNSGGAGGKGGGGHGYRRLDPRNSTDLGVGHGVDGLGGGGGGYGNATGGSGGNGGRGVVILRYRALAGEIFADFAVTNRDTAAVVFKGELAALAGGEEAVNIYFCYAQVGGATNEWTLVKEHWEPTDGFSYTLWPLAAGTDYLYFFKLQGENFAKIYEGRVSTMALHGTGGELHELPDGWFYHSFTNNGVFVAPCDDLEVEYLVVGGGGGGGGCSGNGAYRGGGGGGGQAVTGKVALAAFQECRITIGQGGKYLGDNARGDDGSDSIVEVVGDAVMREPNYFITAYGGGGGGNGEYGGGWYRGTGGGGGNRGSGGTYGMSGVNLTEKRGGNGGNGYNSNNSAGGGGGAGADGANSPSDGTGGKGGDGIESFITGDSVWYGGGGGGGGGSNSGGAGGKGGGGHGYRRLDPRNSTDLGVGHGVDGLGGGGGGYGNGAGGSGGNGGSGIVIVRYRAPAEGVYTKISVSKRESRAMNFVLKMNHLPVTDPAATVDFKFAYHDNAEQSLEELDWQDKGRIVEDFQEGDSASYRLDGIKAGHHYTGIFTVETVGGLKRAYTNDFATLGLVGEGGELHEIGDGWYYHSFTNDGVFVAPEAEVELEYLVVGGGGSGGGVGSYAGGGGGGGAVTTGYVTVTANQECPVTVGIGGIATGDNITRCGSDSNFCVPGENADLDQNFKAMGGGGGGHGTGGAGLSRGTGGGAAGNGGVGAGSQGGAGGKGTYAEGGGGGGGAGQNGANSSSASWGGKGGDGIMSTITGEEMWYGGGGGGTGSSSGDHDGVGGGGGLGGKGGGGRGSYCLEPRSRKDIFAQLGPGQDGFGGGGGGGYGRVGARGGKGVVIVRYRSPEDKIRGRVTINSLGAGYAVVDVETLGDEGLTNLHLFVTAVKSGSSQIYWEGTDKGPTKKGDRLQVPLAKLHPETSYRLWVKIAATIGDEDDDGPTEGTGEGEVAAQFYIDVTTLPVGEMAETSQMEVMRDGTILQTFNAGETFTVPVTAINTSYRYLVVGGGGAGGGANSYAGGGGGGGAVFEGSVTIAGGRELAVQVGAGGVHATQRDGGASTLQIAADGFLVTALGGGGGGDGTGGGGRAGGCGGGAAGNGGVGAGSQGGAGGKGTYAEGGGGGGGASGMAGGNSNGTGWGGRGGDGVSSDISGLTVWYGGGGGGSGNGGTDYYWDTEKTLRGGGGLGGKGGGGRGSYCYDPRTGAGIFAEVGPGTEGVGGGGGGALYGTGANGGRGVVMLRHLPKGQTAEPEHPVGAFTGVGINPDGSLKLTAYTPWAGKGAESVAMELHWGTDRVNLDRMLPLDGNMMGVRDYRFDEVFAGGPDVNNEPAARLYLRLEWESKLKQRYATGVRNILVPLTVQEPLEPGLDRVRRTVNFQGNITVVGWGSSTVKVHYGAAADALGHTIVLATADYGKAPFQYETGALPLNVDGDEIPTLYYQYEIIEVAGGREIRHYHSPIAAVEVFEPQQGDAAYVQGGLVANWDGELNAGAGQPHAAAPEKWVDLVEGREFALSGVAARAEAMVFDGTGFGMLASGDTAATFAQISNGTMEVVLDLGLQEESPLMPVEYLQGNKSFYFNTGYIPNANTELKFKFCSVANGVAWSAPFGAYQDENSVATRIIHNNTSENNFRVYHMSKASGGGNNVALSPFSTGGIVEGSMSRTSATLNGQQIKVTQVAGNATRATIGLMTGGTGSTASGDNSTAKLYYFQILENGTLLHDYVPCRRKRDNAAVFYDRVTGEVLEKSGTGTPVFGVDAPEISLARCESAAVLAQDGGIRLALNEGGREIALGTVAATDAAANDPKLISIIYTNGAPKTVYVNGTRAALGPAGEPEQTPLAEVFEYHLPLTTAGYAGSTELVRFPVPVRVSEAFTGFKYADCPDGAELRFTDAEGNLIPHEIETWDPAGESCVWVLLPKLNGRDNALMMHWKKHEGVEMPANDPTDVWVDYVGVWHMSETEGDTAYDSTKNHYDAVYSIPGGAGPVTDPSLGRIGGARLLTGGEFVTTASRLIDGGVQNLTNGQQLTPSGWFYSSVNTNAYYNFIRKCDGWGKAGWYLNTQGNLTTYNIIGGGTANLQYNGATFYQTRFLHTATYNGRTFVLYRNGSQVASKGDGSPASESTDVLYLCTYLTGYCDEVRIYNGTASADRVRADYDSQTSANFLFAGVAWRTPKSVVPEGEDGAMRLGAASGDYGAFVGAVRSLRLYDRPLSTEEIALNQGVDRDRFAGNRKSASSARAWTRVDSASGANVIEPFPYNILADARQELSAGTASSPYTSPTMLVDGNINQGNGYGINTGATLTYTFPAVVETMFDLRIVNAGVSGRRSSNVTKVEAVDDDGRVFTLAGAAGLNPTAGPIGYLWLRAADQSPIAYNVKKLIITFGSMENGWALFTEVEATGSPYDEARLKEFAAKRRLYGDDWEVQDPAVFVPTNYVFGAIYDPADKNQTVGDAYMTIYYSPDAAAISNHWTTCPAFTSAYDRAARTFAEWAGPMLSETDYYLRAVYIRENSDGIIAARSEVLRYLSVNLENSIFGDGGRMKMTEDDTGDILHIFDTAGDFAFTAPYTESVAIDYLVVGAGGAGANGTAGNPSSAGNGGGGGEAWTNEAPVVVERGEECQIAVGAGSPAPGTGTRAVSSRDGEQSSITIDGEADVALGGARATAFGNAGGDGRRGLNLHSGATGGAGLKCEITGEMVGYAGGGSAGSMNTSGTYAGVDGGGRGASTSVSAESGVRGGGGGGGNNTNAGKAAAGGDGVVIVRHPPTTAEMRATVKTLEARAHFIGVSVRADVIIVDDPRKFREATAEVYFGFGEDPEALEYRLVAEALPLDATWTTNVVSLTPEKTYYYGVVVSNAATQVRRKGAAYTGEATTEPEPDPNLEPMITLVSVTSAVDRISADVLYDTTYAGLDRDYVDVYLLYGDEPDALGNERQIATNVVGYGLYNLDELKLNTNQYVQVFASNDTGKVWSEVKSVFLEAAPKIGDNCRTWWTGATVGESGFAFTILDPGPVGCPGVSDAMVTLEWGVEPNEEALVNHTVIGDDYRVAKEFTFTRNDGFPKTFYYRFRIENFVTHKTGDYNFFSYTPIFRGGGWTLKFNDMSTVAGTITDGDWIFNVAVMRELITVKDVNKAGTDPKVDFAMPVATALRKYFIDAIGDTCFFANTTPNNNARKVMKQCILPDELSSIGYQAFQNLQVLEYLSPIPPRIKALKYGVIYNCPKLTELNLGKVEIVGGDCCGNNAALTNVVAAALTNVGHKAFIGLPALKSITLGSGAVWCDNVDDNGVIATGATGKGFELHFGREPMMRTKGKVFKCLISGQAADPCRIFVDSPRAIEAWKREMKTAEVTDSDLKVADKYGIRREWVFGIYQDRDSSTPRHLLINGSRIPLVIKVR